MAESIRERLSRRLNPSQRELADSSLPRPVEEPGVPAIFSDKIPPWLRGPRFTDKDLDKANSRPGVSPETQQRLAKFFADFITAKKKAREKVYHDFDAEVNDPTKFQPGSPDALAASELRTQAAKVLGKDAKAKVAGGVRAVRESAAKVKRRVETEVNRFYYGRPPEDPKDRVEVFSSWEKDASGQPKKYIYSRSTGDIWDEETGKRVEDKGRFDPAFWRHDVTVEEVAADVRKGIDAMALGGRIQYGNRIMNGRMDVGLFRAGMIVDERRDAWDKATDPVKKQEAKDAYEMEKVAYEDLRKEYLACRLLLRWWYEGVLSEHGGYGKGFAEGVIYGVEEVEPLLQWLFTGRRKKEFLEGMASETKFLDLTEKDLTASQAMGKMYRLGTALAQKDSRELREVKLNTETGESVVILFNPSEAGYKDAAGTVNRGNSFLYELYRTHNFDSYALGYLKTRHKNLAYAFEYAGVNKDGKPVYIFHLTDTYFHAYNIWQMVEMAPFWARQLDTMAAEADSGNVRFQTVLRQMGWNGDFTQGNRQANVSRLTADSSQAIIDSLIYCRFNEFTGEDWNKLNFDLAGTPVSPLNQHAQMELYMKATRDPLLEVLCGAEVEKNLEKLNNLGECWKHIREPLAWVQDRELTFWQNVFDRPTLKTLETLRDGGHRDNVASFFKERIPKGFATAILRRLEFAACDIRTELGANFIDWTNAIQMTEDDVARQTLQMVNEVKVLKSFLREKATGGRDISIHDFATYAGLRVDRFQVYNMAFNLRKMKSKEQIAATPNNSRERQAWADYQSTRPNLREQWVILNPEKAELLFEYHDSFKYEVDQKLWQRYKAMDVAQRQAWLTRVDAEEVPEAEIGDVFQVCMEFDRLGNDKQDSLRLRHEWIVFNEETADDIHRFLDKYPERGTFNKSERGKLEMRAWSFYWGSLADEYEGNKSLPRIDYGTNYDENEEYMRAAWRAERARFGMDLRNEKEKKYLWVEQANGTYQKAHDYRDKIKGRFIRNQVDYDENELTINIWQESDRMFSQEDIYLATDELLLDRAQRGEILTNRFALVGEWKRLLAGRALPTGIDAEKMYLTPAERSLPQADKDNLVSQRITEDRFLLDYEKRMGQAEKLALIAARQGLLAQWMAQNLSNNIRAFDAEWMAELEETSEAARLGLNPIETILYGTGPYLPGFGVENSLLYTDWAGGVIVPRFFVRGSRGFWEMYSVNRAKQLSKQKGFKVSPEEVWKNERLDRRVHDPKKRFAILYALNRAGTLDTDVAGDLMIRFGCTELQAKQFAREQGNKGVQDMEGKMVGEVDKNIVSYVEEAQKMVEPSLGFKIPFLPIVLSPKTQLELVMAARNLITPVVVYYGASVWNFANGVSMQLGTPTGALVSLGIGFAMAFLGRPQGEFVRGLSYFGNKILGTFGVIERCRSSEQMEIDMRYGGGFLGSMRYLSEHPRKIPGHLFYQVLHFPAGLLTKWVSDNDDSAEKLVQAVDTQKTTYGGHGRKN